LINIPAKQTPVINRLHDTMTQAAAYAHAIRDNAQDDGVAIPLDLVASFQETYDHIISALAEAACCMKLTLTQPDLNQALRSVSRAVGTGRNSHPVLAHVLLTTGNGNLQVSAYDLDLGITTPVVAVVDTAGAITIPYRLLADIIGRLAPADVVTLVTDWR
jgi:hypothetical protein